MFLEYVYRLSSLECKTFTYDTLAHSDIELSTNPSYNMCIFFCEPGAKENNENLPSYARV
jgi:hypothetical protein